MTGKPGSESVPRIEAATPRRAMTPSQIETVQQSFRAVVPIKEAAAAIFYRRLFELDPSLRPLFANADMAAQGAKLMAALAFVVQGLTNAERILPAVRELARRHVGYGVREGHYATVGTALIGTLGEGLGEAFTHETREAWAAAYALLSGVMIEAMAARAAA
jgi:hemoglobin-like flavoprotein